MGSLERKLWKPELVQTADPREAKMSRFILKPVLLMEPVVEELPNLYFTLGDGDVLQVLYYNVSFLIS